MSVEGLDGGQGGHGRGLRRLGLRLGGLGLRRRRGRDGCGLWFGRGCLASFDLSQQWEGATYEFFGGGYPQRWAEALDDPVHGVEEEADHLSTVARGLSGVAYEFAFGGAERGVEFVFDYPALGCVPGQGWRSVGLDELHALFDADDG